MNTIFTALIIVFSLSGIAIIIYAYIPNAKDKKAINNDTSKEIEKNLNILNSEKDTNKVAAAFVELIGLSYVLVHVIVNKGNNYKDKVQYKYFCDFLTPEVIARAKSFEAREAYGYIGADTSKDIYFDSECGLYAKTLDELQEKYPDIDNVANDMHEAVVAELAEKIKQ